MTTYIGSLRARVGQLLQTWAPSRGRIENFLFTTAFFAAVTREIVKGIRFTIRRPFLRNILIDAISVPFNLYLMYLMWPLFLGSLRPDFYALSDAPDKPLTVALREDWPEVLSQVSDALRAVRDKIRRRCHVCRNLEPLEKLLFIPAFADNRLPIFQFSTKSKFFAGMNVEFRQLPPQPTVSEWNLSSAKGCSTCSFVLHAVKTFSPGWLEHSENKCLLAVPFEVGPMGILMVERNEGKVSYQHVNVFTQSGESSLLFPIFLLTLFQRFIESLPGSW